MDASEDFVSEKANSSINNDAPRSTTGSGSLHADFNRIYLTNCLKCKLLSYEEYRLILYFIAGVYVFFLGVGLWTFSYEVRSTFTLVGAIFILITAVVTLLNIIIIIRVIHVPKEKLALASGLVMLLLMISNIIIFVSLYDPDDDTKHAISAMNIFFAVFQFYASYILYRYSEFVKFNYDENISEILQEIAEGRYSAQSITSLPALPPTNNHTTFSPFSKHFSAQTIFALNHLAKNQRPSSVRSNALRGSEIAGGSDNSSNSRPSSSRSEVSIMRESHSMPSQISHNSNSRTISTSVATSAKEKGGDAV